MILLVIYCVYLFCTVYQGVIRSCSLPVVIEAVQVLYNVHVCTYCMSILLFVHNNDGMYIYVRKCI